ncbi:MAG: phospholipid carrier-dependent glycosyltransferase [Thermoanaerobaculia bacterium]
MALGLGLLAQALFLFGISGRFGAGALVVVAGLALVCGARNRKAARADLAEISAGRRARSPLFWCLAVGALAGPAWLALYPPIAWDDTIYHLPLARSLVEHGRYLFVGNLRAPVFPLLGETLFAPALLCGRASTAHGVSLVATCATALLLLAWGEGRFVAAGRTDRSASWALAPAAIWIGQPIVVFYAGSTFIEPLLTLFATASVLSFECWRSDRSDQSERRLAWLLAAGAFAGWAAATKYLGLYLVAALALAAAWEAGRGSRLRAAAQFAGAAGLVAAPWYALIWVLAGNPLFPFLGSLFGGGAWREAEAVSLSGVETGWLANGLGLLRLGWDLVVSRARVGAQPPASPLVIAALPLLLYVAWRERRARLWVAIIAGFAVVFFALPRDSRYLMFLSPLLAVLLAAALRDLLQRAATCRPVLSRLPSLAAGALVLLGIATGPAYALWRTRIAGPPPITAAATDAFLARRLPLYRALLFRRARSLEEVPLYALHGERLHDFGGSALLGDWIGPYRFQLVLPLLDRPEELARQLHELGAAQLLLPRSLVSRGVVEGLVASPRFRELYRDDDAVLFALVTPR